MSGAHALVAPSGLHLTMECAFSLLAQLMAPPVEESEEEAEGTAAHWHALQWAQGNKIPVGAKFKSNGKEWEVTRDMATGSQMYANEAVYSSSSRYEDPISVPDIHAQCYGTPDYWRWMPEINTLKVVDYKYGHRYVDAFENWQLLAYALGVARRLGGLPANAKIILVIVQPRCFFKTGNYGQEWETTLAQLFSYVERIVAQVSLALNPNAPARTGKHCLDCKARGICHTLQRGAMHVVEFVGVGDAQQLDNNSLGVEAHLLYQASKVIEARLDGLKAQIEARERSGQGIPYWEMSPTRSLWKWNEGITTDAIRLLGMAAGGVETVHPPKPITPTQAKDAGVDETLLNAYATRIPPGKSLKPLSSTTASKVFFKP